MLTLAPTATPALPQAPTDSPANSQGEQDTGALCLVLIADFLGVPASAGQLRHEAGLTASDFTVEDLVRAARQLGLKARAVRSKPDRLAAIHPPAIAEMNDGRFIVLGKLADQQLLVQDPLKAAPEILPLSDFERAWTGRLVLLQRRAAEPDEERRFSLGWFVAAARKYRGLLGEVLIASLILQLFGLVTPLLFQEVIDKVLTHRSLTTLEVLSFGLLAVAVFEILLGWLRTYVMSHTTNRLDVELGTRMFRQLLGLPLSYFQARRVGDSISRIRELDTVRSFLTGSALSALLDTVFGLVFFAVMFYYSPLLSLIVLATVPVYAGISFVITPVLQARVQERSARSAETQSFLVELVSAVETLKAMAIEPQMHRRFEEQLAAATSAGFRVNLLSTLGAQLVGIVSKLSTVGLLWLGSVLVIGGDLSVGQLVAFNMLAGRVAAPILRLSQLWQEFQQVRVSIKRIADIMNTPTEAPPSANSSMPTKLAGDIRFERVVFRYQPNGPEILSDISFHVEPGQIVGVVGASGSGKSTLTKLVQRLLVPERGRVLVDGMDLAQIDPAWLRRQIGVVLQENVLFSRTIRENIALVDPTLSMDAVIEAAKLAGAHDFILELPQGYDTPVGERGASLSGGQRQRIAIARALINDPQILVFDEATSALDYESERIIQRNMRRICAGRTVIIIAHRLSTVRFADRILTLERGRLVEDGTHEDLLKVGGRYATLHAIQSGVADAG